MPTANALVFMRCAPAWLSDNEILGPSSLSSSSDSNSISNRNRISSPNATDGDGHAGHMQAQGQGRGQSRRSSQTGAADITEQDTTSRLGSTCLAAIARELSLAMSTMFHQTSKQQENVSEELHKGTCQVQVQRTATPSLFLTPSFPPSLPHSLTTSLPHSLPPSLIPSLTHSLRLALNACGSLSLTVSHSLAASPIAFLSFAGAS